LGPLLYLGTGEEGSLFDIEYINSDSVFVSGCDEVGRGPLAGPVVAATAYLTLQQDYEMSEIKNELTRLSDLGVTDSKKLTQKKRLKALIELGVELSSLEEGRKYLLTSGNKYSIEFAVSEISETSIDEINILNASLLAMKTSFELCHEKGSGILLIDGNKPINDLPTNVEGEPIVKGDSKSILIGLASIIAKEYRDLLMVKLGEKYPGYGLEKHAGYPTKDHKEAIRTLGVTPIHRKSFKGVKEFVQKG
jgi:ribonuclease HII